jgi:hypothetical protein
MEVGLWRSRLGDTHPHTGVAVDLDYWPQGTHVRCNEPALVLCATGAGGGSQQAIFRADLDPLRSRGVARWKAGPRAAPRAELDALFAAIQREFEELHSPFWAGEFQASAVAVVLEPWRCAIANVGVERAWLLRDGRFERVSQDDTLGDDMPEAPAWMRDWPASSFGRFGGAHARWHTRELALRDGDVLVLASGASRIGLDDAGLGAELTAILAETPAARDAAQRLGDYAAAVERRITDPGDDTLRGIKWRVHSRLALAVIRPM